jgi:hypothetical protein
VLCTCVAVWWALEVRWEEGEKGVVTGTSDFFCAPTWASRASALVRHESLF